MVFGPSLSIVGGGLHLAAGHYDPDNASKLIDGGLAGAIAGAMCPPPSVPAAPDRVIRVAGGSRIAVVLVRRSGNARRRTEHKMSLDSRPES